MTTERATSHFGKNNFSLRSPFKLYDSDKENQAVNTHKKPKVSTERSVTSHFDSKEYSSTNSLYAGRLQMKLSSVSHSLADCRKQLKAVTEQRNCLKLICEKQSARLSQSNNKSQLQILKQDYQLQIEELQKERQKVGQLLTQINADHVKEIEQMEARLERSAGATVLLERKCENLTEQNRRLQQQSEMLMSNLMEKDVQIEKIKEELFQKRNVDKKYRLALQELERLDQSGRKVAF